jgi:endo-1,4-beta-D-glucanase Y
MLKKILILSSVIWLPVSAAINFPFPNNAKYPFGIKPDTMSQVQMNQACVDWFEKWKQKYVTSSGCKTGEYRVQRLETGDANKNDCVSEAIGYGMVIMVYMCNESSDTKKYFDGFWTFYKNHPSGGAMAWRIGSNGDVLTNGTGAATDADLDAAFALFMADKQWGSSGQINYLDEAKKLAQYILSAEVHENNLRPGNAEYPYWDFGNPGYLAPAYYQIFKRITSDGRWGSLLSNCYNGIVNYYYNSNETKNASLNMSTGLQPNWCNYGGGFANPGDWSMDPHSYWWDACRFPWRQGYDYLLHGTSGSNLAKDNTERVSKFFKTLTNYHPEKIRSHYALDGKEKPWSGNLNPILFSEDTMNLPGFVGSTAVAAMVEGDKRWLNLSFQRLVDMNNRQLTETNVDWGTDYFCDILKMLYLLVLSGNMPDLSVSFQKEQISAVEPARKTALEGASLSVMYDKNRGVFTVKIADGNKNAGKAGVYNSKGQLVKVLENGACQNGCRSYTISASLLCKGVYFIKAEIVNSELVKKIVLF